MIISGKQGFEPAKTIVRLNAMIKTYAKEYGCIYLDYFSAMADERNSLRAGLGDDDIHPNLARYKIMAPLAEQAIQQALKTHK